ncbi:MAG: hypothetical protein ABII01_04295 [Candidatus Woesearchaeota archaeon]
MKHLSYSSATPLVKYRPPTTYVPLRAAMDFGGMGGLEGKAMGGKGKGTQERMPLEKVVLGVIKQLWAQASAQTGYSK